MGDLNCTYGFLRGEFEKPAFVLPGTELAIAAVRFCPFLFRQDKEPSGKQDIFTNVAFLELPYRFVWAVMSGNEVFVYESNDQLPIAKFADLHHLPLSDIAWQGYKKLVVSSFDGFVTVIEF